MGTGEFCLTKKTFRRIFSFFIFLLITLVSVFLFLHSSFFNIDEIYTTGLNQISDEEVLTYSNLNMGQNIFSIKPKLITQTIKVHPIVKDVQIIRHLPRTLEIKVVERHTWAIVPFQNEFLCIDDEGIVIDKKTMVDFSIYPFINLANFPERINFGQALAPIGISQIKNVWDKLGDFEQESISDFYFNDKEELIIYTINGTEIRFGDMERFEEKTTFIKEVFKIEAEFKESGSDVLEYIDLRFKGQPIVKMKE